MKINYPYLMPDKDRHGNERFYVRRLGRKLRIREAMGTAEFQRAYKEAVERLAPALAPIAISDRSPQPGSLGWLAMRYFASQHFGAKAPREQSTRRNVIESCLREKIRDDSNDTFRDLPLVYVDPRAIQRLRDLKLTPGAANNRKKYLSAMYRWAINDKNLDVVSNPCRDVPRIDYASSGFHTWSLEEIAQYRTRWAIGTKERLALEMLLFLGTRKGDFVKLGRQHVKAGTIKFVQNKTRYKNAEAIQLFILPSLQAVIDATPTGDLTFMTNSYGRAFTVNGFGNWFRERCNLAGLPQCSAHGLRKAGATIAAENGATIHQLMAMYGWRTPAQAMTYTRAADQKRMAHQTAMLLEHGTEAEQNDSPGGALAADGTAPPK